MTGWLETMYIQWNLSLLWDTSILGPDGMSLIEVPLYYGIESFQDAFFIILSLMNQAKQPQAEHWLQICL